MPFDCPELMLLLATARVDLPPGVANVLGNLLSGPLDWEHLLALAARHGLEPLLFHHVHAVTAGMLPPDILQILRNRCKLIAGRNMILASKLTIISAHLSACGIPHLAYKGPALAELCYGNCTLRVFRDLDILVHQVDLEETRNALQKSGFIDKGGLSADQQAASFQFGFEHLFTSKEGIDLDVHWRLVQRFKSRAIDMEGIWKRAAMVKFWGSEVPTFAAEDLLIALCLHAGHHGWMHISQMVDIHQVLESNPRLDWGIVESQLGDSNTQRIVHVSLFLLREYWEAKLPESLVIKMQADPHVERLGRRVLTEIWPSLSPALTTASLRWMLDRSAGERVADRARLLAGSIFCPAVEDFQTFRLPLALAPLYPGLRAFRLAYRFLKSRSG